MAEKPEAILVDSTISGQWVPCLRRSLPLQQQLSFPISAPSGTEARLRWPVFCHFSGRSRPRVTGRAESAVPGRPEISLPRRQVTRDDVITPGALHPPTAPSAVGRGWWERAALGDSRGQRSALLPFPPPDFDWQVGGLSVRPASQEVDRSHPWTRTCLGGAPIGC